MAATVPERPAGVPEGGFWSPEVGGWEVSRLNAQGAREGECLFYRPDGSLQSRCGFVAGVREGPFAMFHPDGRVSREGIFSAGRAEGIVSAYPGVGPGAEPLRSCCVPPGAVRLDLRFEEGEVVQEIFYDADGRPILSDGRPWPPRPSGVPDDAEYEEAAPQWVRRRAELHRFWNEAGVLVSEIEFANGVRRAERTFDAAGGLAEACEFSPDRARHGAFLRRLPREGGGAYADARIREERGTFDHGQAVGTWSFLDAAGGEVATVARGVAFAEGDEAASPAFAPGAGQTAEATARGTAQGTADDWWTLSRTLRAEGRVREALCAAARAAVRAGDRAALERALAADVVALGPALAAQRGEALEQSVEVKVWSILDALVCGADAASAFRALAAVLPGVSAAAADFVEASLLLAPERRTTHLTRALVRLQRGDEEGARADLVIVAAESPSAAASLVGQLQAVLRPFDNWPAREPLLPDPLLADVGAGLVRELDEVRATIGLYATRIGRVRAAVQALIGRGVTPAWLPPDLSGLLPAGPVALRRAQVSVDLGEGEMAEVEINEEIATGGLGVPALLGEAQADWGALCWLCWSVGLTAPALPQAVSEPPLFAVAMKTIVTRCWRAQDRLKSGGLLARANGVPGFEWQGIDIDALPLHLARAVAEEYLRARSVFLWLASPDVVSPFQVDLRDD